MNGHLCFQRTDIQSNNKVIAKIDTGIRNNFILKDQVKHGKLIKLRKSFFYDGSKITHYVRVNLFSHDLVFCIVDTIENFDLILGMNGLRKIGAIIDMMSFTLTYRHTRNKKCNIEEQMIERSIEIKSDIPLNRPNAKVKDETRTSPILLPKSSHSYNGNGILTKRILRNFKKSIHINHTTLDKFPFHDILSSLKDKKFFHKRFLNILTVAA